MMTVQAPPIVPAAAAVLPPAARLRITDRLAIGGVVLLLGFFVALPLASVAFEALRHGLPAAAAVFVDPYALSAIVLTGIVTAITIVVNGAFGVFVAWTLTKYRFPGKTLLLTIIDLPLTVSPVVAGLAVLLCFGLRSPAGAWFAAHGMKIAFAPPGIILATIFVTFPYVARETVALMNETGLELEEAALGLGASVWQTFTGITLPRVRWALLNGLLLVNARALGEFGAVSVISGRIRGLTDTVPLHIEILYNEDNLVGAFTLAALLATVAIALTLIHGSIERRRKWVG